MSNNGQRNNRRSSDEERRRKPNCGCNNHGDTCKDHEKREKCHCDCCCTTGMREELKDLKGKLVLINTTGGTVGGIVPLIGVIKDVDCDVVEFGWLEGLGLGISIPTFISLCEVTSVLDLSLLAGGYGYGGVGGVVAAPGTTTPLLSLVAALGLGEVLTSLGVDLGALPTPPTP